MGDTEAGATELRFDGLQHLLGCHQISIAHVRHSSLRVPVRLDGRPPPYAATTTNAAATWTAPSRRIVRGAILAPSMSCVSWRRIGAGFGIMSGIMLDRLGELIRIRGVVLRHRDAPSLAFLDA